MITLGIFFFTFCVTIGLTWLVLIWLRAKEIMDMPNERSSHSIPTPRGGGLATTLLILLGFIAWFIMYGASASDWSVLIGATLLAAISWMDDRITLSAAPRFAIQIAIVTLSLSLMPQSQILGGMLPSVTEKFVLGVAWVWFLNLYNFMDGIDGITGIETACIALGLMIAAPAAIPTPLLAIVAAAASGFLVWNWHPAKIFMGDVGSIPLGFILGYFLITTAQTYDAGWAVALILPALYWADATFTLCHRALQKKKIWQAHREHFYQKATQGNPATRWSHAKVSSMILFGNIALIGLAHSAVTFNPWPALLAAVLTTAAVLIIFQATHQKSQENPENPSQKWQEKN